jgi:hypothetical protein
LVLPTATALDRGGCEHVRTFCECGDEAIMRPIDGYWRQSLSDSGGAAKTRIGAMEDIRSIVARLPQHEFDIRRRCAHDSHFRSICADYEETARALRYWQKAAQAEDRKKGADRNVEEYANFLGELEAEIVAHLNRSISNA